MAMSDRPKWMPSRESLLSLAHNETLYHNCGHAYAGEELEEMIRCAGLRAKIEALEELLYDCDINDAEATVVHTGQIQQMIWALDKELNV